MMSQVAVEVPYKVSDEPRTLVDDDLKFLAEYTKCSDHDKLRNRALQIWREVKQNVSMHVHIEELSTLNVSS